MRKFGAFETAAALAAPQPVLLHNTGANFLTDHLRGTYKAIKAAKSFRGESARLPDDSLISWIAGLKSRYASYDSDTVIRNV